MRTMTVKGWIAVTRSGRVSRKNFVKFDDGTTAEVPKVHLYKKVPESFLPPGTFARRVTVTIAEVR